MRYFSNFCLSIAVSFFYILVTRIPFVFDSINSALCVCWLDSFEEEIS